MSPDHWVRKPQLQPGETPLFLYEVLDATPLDARILDAGCGPGSWDYGRSRHGRITGFDIKFPPGPPRREGTTVFRGDLARLPIRSETFDLTVCHYVLEHVTELEASCNELVRVTKPDGLLYLSVPRAAAFDDRLYRFAGYFAKYALLKFRKRIEHQQRFDFDLLVDLFARRGFGLTAYARVPAGFSWMNDARTKPLQGPFTDSLAWIHRVTGMDLAADANFVMTFRRGASGAPPSEIAGQASTLTRALRALGVEAHSLATNPGFPQYRPDEMRPYDDMAALPRYAGYLGNLARHLGRYDVYHFHFGRSLVPPHNPDLPLYRGLGGKVVFHYHGCDVRNRAHMVATHKYATCTECDPFCNPSRQQTILRSAVRHADAEIVSTPDLLESASRASHLPVAIDLDGYAPRLSSGAPKRVVHAPTNRLIKGTRHVEAAYGALRERFPSVEFLTVEGRPWNELIETLATADVVVDQLFMGWYGVVAVEAMALGKPVLCYIRPEFEPRLNDCPIVRVTREDLVEQLAAVLDGGDRARLGEAGRAFVERENAAPVVAARLIELYREIGARGA
jgi:SAM-dependent methyltransferase